MITMIADGLVRHHVVCVICVYFCMTSVRDNCHANMPLEPFDPGKLGRGAL